MRSQKDYDALEARVAELQGKGAPSVRSDIHARPFDPELDLTPSARPGYDGLGGFKVVPFAGVQGDYVILTPPDGDPWLLPLSTATELGSALIDCAERVRDEHRAGS
ncbi:MAG: hypothetical protein V3S01_06820 [Dehalococcoidia bacterium]